MPSPIGIISKRLEDFLLAQIDQQETEQHQHDAADGDRRVVPNSSVAMP
jgi:hypothetical protein